MTGLGKLYFSYASAVSSHTNSHSQEKNSRSQEENNNLGLFQRIKGWFNPDSDGPPRTNKTESLLSLENELKTESLLQKERSLSKSRVVVSNKHVLVLEAEPLTQDMTSGLTSNEKADLRELWIQKSGNGKKIGSIDFQCTNPAEVLGGHGNVLNITCIKKNKGEIKEETHLFLKPLDPAELKNYQLYKTLHESLLKAEDPKYQIYTYMPYVYGNVNIGGKDYLMMDDSLEGGKKTPLFDGKLAGLLPEDEEFNPIVDPKELEHNGTSKTDLHLGYMRQICIDAKNGDGDLKEGGYLIASKGPRILRPFSYGQSVERLKTAIGGLDIEQLESLMRQLVDLKGALLLSETASIGGSVFAFQDKTNGSVGIRFIDPAHIQVNPDSEAGNCAEANSVFLGHTEDFAKRVRSNQNAIDSMIRTVAAVIIEKEKSTPF